MQSLLGILFLPLSLSLFSQERKKERKSPLYKQIGKQKTETFFSDIKWLGIGQWWSYFCLSFKMKSVVDETQGEMKQLWLKLQRTEKYGTKSHYCLSSSQMSNLKQASLSFSGLSSFICKKEIICMSEARAPGPVVTLNPCPFLRIVILL